AELDAMLEQDPKGPAAKKLATLKSDIAEAEGLLNGARLALQVAQQDEREARGKFRADLRASQIRVCASHLRKRDAAAERLSLAIQQACDAFRDVQRHAIAARRATPVGSTWTNRSASGPEQAGSIVADELHRCGHAMTDPDGAQLAS